MRRLVDLPAGQRPLRSVVGHLLAEFVAEFNDAYDRAKLRPDEALKRPDRDVAEGTAKDPTPNLRGR